ncbi:MAG TPA: DUF933 domain-containing protein [Limnochordales bacterium]
MGGKEGTCFSMRLGVTGLPGCGKSTLLAAAAAWADVLSGQAAPQRPGRAGPSGSVAVCPIPDPRVEWLAGQLHPRKVTYATVEWVELPALRSGLSVELARLDGLVMLVRAFDPAQQRHPHPDGRVDPAADLKRLWQEWLSLDWGLVAQRLERLRSAASVPRAQRRPWQQEVELLERCLAALEQGIPLRQAPLSEDEQTALRGYNLVTFLPVVAAASVQEPPSGDGRSGPLAPLYAAAGQLGVEVVEVAAELELELARLDPATREGFMRELGLEPPPGVLRLAQAAYRACHFISFLTAGEQEVRAWTIRRGTTAKEAAGKVHSDMERGFIRAEVVAFADLQRAGSLARARQAGLLRLEGKEYVMQDGDVVEFRFHV